MVLLRMRVLAPDRVVLDENVRSLVAPAWDGRVGVYPRHAPFLAILDAGPLVFVSEDGEERRISIDGGVLKVADGKATALADGASDPAGPPATAPPTAPPAAPTARTAGDRS